MDLKQAIPLKKMTSDISMTTGVSGPAGRRLSVKLGITPGITSLDNPRSSELGPVAEGVFAQDLNYILPHKCYLNNVGLPSR